MLLGGNLKGPAKKKTPPPGLLIAVKAKPKADDAPPPEDAAPDMPMDKPVMDEPEPPAMAGDGEDYGKKLTTDMMRPLIDAGMDEASAKTTLADMFRAAIACIEGDKDDADPAMAGIEGEEPAA